MSSDNVPVTVRILEKEFCVACPAMLLVVTITCDGAKSSSARATDVGMWRRRQTVGCNAESARIVEP